MEATADNFKALFEIVQTQLAKLRDVGASSPLRNLQRRKSDPLYPRGSPGSRRYNVKGKGRVDCQSEPPVSGNCSSRAKRRFTKKKTKAKADRKKTRKSCANNAVNDEDDDDDDDNSADRFLAHSERPSCPVSGTEDD